MIKVSETASQNIKAFLAERKLDSALRIIAQAGGCCGGPSLRLVLDEAKAGDHKYEVDGLTYLIGSELAAESGEVSIDYLDNGYQQGFVLSSANPLAGAGADCGGGCGGGCSC
ncbi:MAG: IscA/HesB family protein [Thermodesulfobacteriota bacterium]